MLYRNELSHHTNMPFFYDSTFDFTTYRIFEKISILKGGSMKSPSQTQILEAEERLR